MKELLRNWNYGKHACTVTGLYLLILLGGNLMLGTHRSLKKTEGKEIAKRIHKLKRNEKIFNIAAAGCYFVDMTLSFGIIKWFQKKMMYN